MMYAAPMAMGLLSGLTGYMNTPDYQGISQQFTNQMQGLSDQWNPYLQRADQARKGQIGMNAYQMANPAGLENRLSSSFTNSPYQNQLLTNTQNQMNANAANTGMLGSTAQQGQLQNQMAGQENQWQQQYIDRGTNQYNMASNHLNQMATMMQQQGFNAQQIQDAMMEKAYQSQMQAALQPSRGQNALTGFVGGIEGLL